MRIFEIEINRRNFLKGAAAATVAASAPMNIARDLLANKTSVTSLEIFNSFLKFVPKIGLNFSEIAEIMDQADGGGDHKAFDLTSDDFYALDEKGFDIDRLDQELDNHFEKKFGRKYPIYHDKLHPDHELKPYHRADHAAPYQWGMGTEPREYRKARNELYDRLLGRKTQITKLDDWATEIGKKIGKDIQTFEELYDSPEGKTIWDNIIWLSEHDYELNPDWNNALGYGEDPSHAAYDPIKKKYYNYYHFDKDNNLDSDGNPTKVRPEFAHLYSGEIQRSHTHKTRPVIRKPFGDNKSPVYRYFDSSTGKSYNSKEEADADRQSHQAGQSSQASQTVQDVASTAVKSSNLLQDLMKGINIAKQFLTNPKKLNSSIKDFLSRSEEDFKNQARAAMGLDKDSETPQEPTGSKDPLQLPHITNTKMNFNMPAKNPDEVELDPITIKNTKTSSNEPDEKFSQKDLKELSRIKNLAGIKNTR